MMLKEDKFSTNTKENRRPMRFTKTVGKYNNDAMTSNNILTVLFQGHTELEI